MGAYVTNVKFVNPTSVKEIDAQNIDFTIYTNSDTNKLIIKSKDKTIENIQLLDMTGIIVCSAVCSKLNNEIILSGIASGLYIVKIDAENNNYTSKFISK